MEIPASARRVGYRVAYRVLQVVWYLTRPRIEGVKCLITDGDDVLLVRHTYGHRWWDVPGGRLRRDEPPARAAHREMREELGIDGADWTAVGQITSSFEHRRDTLHVFRVDLPSPQLTPDPGELAAVRWFPRAALPPDLSPYVVPILARTTVIRRADEPPLGD